MVRNCHRRPKRYLHAEDFESGVEQRQLANRGIQRSARQQGGGGGKDIGPGHQLCRNNITAASPEKSR